MTPAQDVAVVGAGIVGLAHAWSAAERGHRVTVFDRSARACGASIRNFGMVWVVGQPAGELRDLALVSRQRWLELGKSAAIWVQPCGSIHLAYRPDEWSVLEEFHAEMAGAGHDVVLLTAREVLERSPAARPTGLRGGLFSSTELCVHPRVAIRSLPAWLSRRYGVQFEFQTAVTDVEPGTVTTADRRRWRADRVVVCGGDDLQTLYPELLAGSGIRRCKLQMLKTGPQPDGWRLGPHLAGGLTLRHYANFARCPSLAALKERIHAETPELDRCGIHVMASQNCDGEVVLGDSHEYEGDVEPFDKTIIDELILRELRTMIRLPDWTITERWHGTYAKHPTKPWWEASPQPGVDVCTATGGAGMTLAFGLAERNWHIWSPRSQ